jgi:hypothetical protein
VPAFQLRQADCSIELLAISPDAPRQSPVSPVTGKAQRRATLGAVEGLLEE